MGEQAGKQRRDIETRADIERLVDTFYSRVMVDPLIGPIFTEVARLDLPTHMPVMCNFWENILFGAHKYPGGMMMRHVQLHLKTALTPHHFQRWLDSFVQTVDELFSGERATLAKIHAGRVASMMAGRFSRIPSGSAATPTPPSCPD
jgi:hemoglobin